MRPTVGSVRARLVAQLRDAGIDEAEREADMIIEHATGLSKARQMAEPERPISAPEHDLMISISLARQQRQPLQYLLGQTWFMGFPFKTRPGALIPRPETETLVFLGYGHLMGIEEAVFVDIGTGSGCIAISLLKLMPGLRGYAVDISHAAVELARENAELNGVAGRLQLVHSDWLDFDPGECVHLVISNPPYIPRSQAPELQPEVRVFEPEEALFGPDEDGLGFFRALCQNAGRLLYPDNMLAVEVGDGQSDAVSDIFRDSGWSDIRIEADLSRRMRCIAGYSPKRAIEKYP
jgi:release factor glutamine methyltransferase